MQTHFNFFFTFADKSIVYGGFCLLGTLGLCFFWDQAHHNGTRTFKVYTAPVCYIRSTFSGNKHKGNGVTVIYFAIPSGEIILRGTRRSSAALEESKVFGRPEFWVFVIFDTCGYIQYRL